MRREVESTIQADPADRVEVSDKHYVTDTDSNPKVGAVADKLSHLPAYARHQKAIFQRCSLILGPPGDFTEGSLVQPDDSSNIFIKVHSIPRG